MGTNSSLWPRHLFIINKFQLLFRELDKQYTGRLTTTEAFFWETWISAPSYRAPTTNQRTIPEFRFGESVTGLTSKHVCVGYSQELHVPLRSLASVCMVTSTGCIGSPRRPLSGSCYLSQSYTLASPKTVRLCSVRTGFHTDDWGVPEGVPGIWVTVQWPSPPLPYMEEHQHLKLALLLSCQLIRWK